MSIPNNPNQGFENEGRDLTSSQSRPSVALVYSACHQRGGVERVVLESANYLQRRGYQGTVLASEFPPRSEVEAGLRFHRIGDNGMPFGLGLPIFQRRAERAIQGGRFDVVAGFGVQAPPGSVLWVQSVHAAWWEQCRERRRGFQRIRQQWNPFHRVVLKMEHSMFAKRRYRRVLALTTDVKSDLQKFYGVPEEDVDLLPNGFRAGEFHLGLRSQFRVQVRERLKIPSDAWVVLFVANEWERKGLLSLLEAIGRTERDVHLIAAGRLPQRMLLEAASRHGISERVHFVGSSAPVNTWFGAADAFALPTLYEAWGMVIVEALASGLPVLTSSSAGAAMLVTPGASGVLLEAPQDVSEVLSGLLQLRRGVRFSGVQIAASVSAYEWSEVFGRYESILRGVM